MLSLFRQNQSQHKHNVQSGANNLQNVGSSAEGATDIGNQHGGGMEHPLFRQLVLNRECTICMDTKPLEDFPRRRTTSTCDHLPTACRECIQTSLLAQFEEKAMEHITCLECPEMLAPSDVQTFVPRAKYQTYAEHAMNKTLSSIGQFVWCPFGGCESGQIHSPGAQQPVVLCQSCGRQFCFTHHTSWHREHTCEEWDQFLADDSFRSWTQREEDRENAYDADMAALDRRINEAEYILRESIMSAEEAAKERFEFAEARRRRRRSGQRPEEPGSRNNAAWPARRSSGSWYGAGRWRRARRRFRSCHDPVQVANGLRRRLTAATTSTVHNAAVTGTGS
ncbi:hypothetical protein PG997_012893 [Apiospora hydei]|uniref:IBR domain-containing protein n=1 Tax=Apiospora hydei TaxID=1337664 RepID=A0ABR1V4N6_9PEZI